YLLAAANQGMPMAQHLVSLQYLRGDGTEMNLEQALRWSSAAAENGIAEAQYNAAMIGVRHDNASMQDYVNSYKWFTILAARGYPGSIHNREQIMQFMTPEAIDEGNRLAQQWQPPADSEMGLREEEAEKPGIKVKGGKAKPRR
ncbi:MAG: tetratricopeptide repeat protein, partial [Dongiaceae bacterium]